ncbi:MAG: response regulator [Hyphomonadaceae bacterium]|nr:response regulator [Hyphomonadaceae bacterium]
MDPGCKFNFSGVRVGVLESSKFAFHMLRNVLAGYGFRSIAAFDTPAEALSKLAIMPVDVFFIDPIGRHRAVFAAARTLREPRFGETSIAPFAVITTEVSLDVMKLARESGVDAVIAKPFSPNALLERILWAAKRPGRRDALAPTALEPLAGGSVEVW